ncbi:MAG: electron transport complex subunit RsxC [Caldisericia bacterium]|nr:electron transport complex subunit RsxC [Caldisericia bacterium]
MKIKTFHPGGMHIPDHKDRTKDKPIVDMAPGKDLLYPLSQHVGIPAEPIVEAGQEVLIGQLIAKAQGDFSSNIHASVSGIVKDIKEYPHPISGLGTAIHIENDFQYSMLPSIKPPCFESEINLKAFVSFIQEAGIVGMGGATFPTHLKLNPPPDSSVDTYIINGAECEPYLTCDHRLMLEKTKELFDGLQIVQSYLRFKKVIVGIENNKMDAIEHLQNYVQENPMDVPVEIVPLVKKYPQGAEKNLIFATTNRIVPVGKLPFSVGCIVQNVGTLIAISQAIREGTPMIYRVLTASGDCLQEPKNIRVPIGTLLSDIVTFCGGFVKDPKELVFGGPMMGVNQRSQDVPVLKGTSGIIFLSTLEPLHETSCIRCGRCIENCPAGLMPYRFVELAKKNHFEDANHYFVNSCIECGLCTYNCPARIPILNYIRVTKQELKRKRSR